MNQKAFDLHNPKVWKVDTSESFSDHRYIQYELCEFQPVKSEYRNLKKADWASFNIDVSKLPMVEASTLDACATAFEAAIIDQLNFVCPLKAAINRRPNPWWNSKLNQLRSKVRRLGAAKARRNSEEYGEALREFKREVLKAKKNSWRDFCSKADGAKDVANIIKILTKNTDNGDIGLIKDLNGNFTNSPKETLTVLLDTHLPESKVAPEEEEEEEEETDPDPGVILGE
jgi:hypothetical protein